MPWLEWLERQQDVEAAGHTPYRLLEPVAKLDYGEADASNMLIEGDNLDALKALLPYYGGEVKCIFIDPPYNTKSAFEQYDDNLEHAKWLSMMYPRLEMLRGLMRQDGSIWITIDDNEGHYLKVICDEVFGRSNFIANVIWRKNYAPKSSARHFSVDHDHILVYARNAEKWTPNLVKRSAAQDKIYKNPDADPRGLWRPDNLTARNSYSLGTYGLTTPGGRVIDGPPKGRFWAISKAKMDELDKDNRIWWGNDGNNVPALKRFLTEVKQGRVPQTYWSWEEVGHTQDAKKESVILFGDAPFGTPKPEKLMQRIIEIATEENDLVLDSFLGSGTTTAVAQKMGRHWIGIEAGEHAQTHCLPRMQKVIDGEQGGVSEELNWQGGGGFRYYKLGPTVFDENGHIRDGIRFEWLAAHVWFAETGSARSSRAKKVPLLGVHEGVAYYLLFNGVLGDKRPDGGNVLTLKVLAELPEHDGPKVIYGEASRLGPERLKALGITFRQTPYDIKAR
ncbi:site-specific DNA-methyltransferase [Xanthomonas translucens]|uniref:site-specific DNA-methyltransferase n=1 Tax=Xanthomonas campestris pv. translucens TaxID=343 RepID=UPI00071E759F|nr:site-specific DNA-methyltransferase [Xanthomonas translucens]